MEGDNFVDRKMNYIPVIFSGCCPKSWSGGTLSLTSMLFPDTGSAFMLKIKPLLFLNGHSYDYEIVLSLISYIKGVGGVIGGAQMQLKCKNVKVRPVLLKQY